MNEETIINKEIILSYWMLERVEELKRRNQERREEYVERVRIFGEGF